MTFNLKQELKNFSKIDSKKIGADIPENIKNSIAIYNKALDNVKSGSEDIAVIELKKVISMNPSFYEAMNLLGVCYYYMKEYPKAHEVFEKVTKLERNGIIASNYIKEIRKLDNSSTDIEKNDEGNTRGNFDILAGVFNKGFWTIIKIMKKDYFRDYSKYVIGFIIATIIFAVISGIYFSRENEYEQELESYRILSDELELLKNDYNTLKEKHNKASEDLDNTMAERDNYMNIATIYEIKNLYAEKKYESAADRIMALKTVEFKGEQKEMYDNLVEEIIPKASWAVYDEGKRLYNQAKYQEAVNKLSKLKDYGGEFDYTPNAIYTLGKCYVELNDLNNALASFQTVIEKYPDSQFAGYSQNRKNEIMGVQ